MKKLLVTLLILTFPYIGKSQLLSTLAVTGTANYKAKPDMVIITAFIASNDSIYSRSISTILGKAKDIKEELNKNNIKESKIKTTAFNVTNTNYAYGGYYNYDSNKKKQFVANITITIEDIYSEEFVQKTLDVLKKDKYEATININYDFSEKMKKVVNDSLLSIAVKDAEQKASILAKTSGCEIVRISKLSYGDGNVYKGFEYPYSPVVGIANTTNSGTDNCTLDFCPTERNMTDKVNIEWEMKKK